VRRVSHIAAVRWQAERQFQRLLKDTSAGRIQTPAESFLNRFWCDILQADLENELMARATHQREVDENYSIFIQLLPDLIKSHAGKYAVMRQGQVIEFFDTLADAVRYGHAKFGEVNFSVQEVIDQNVNLGAHSYAVYEPID
jgi:hypothetical protein